MGLEKTSTTWTSAARRWLVRVNINVPMERRTGSPTPTPDRGRSSRRIDDVLAGGGKRVLLAHFGRPKGKPVPEMSRPPCIARLPRTCLGREVRLTSSAPPGCELRGPRRMRGHLLL